MTENPNENIEIPEPPKITAEQLAACRQDKDFRPILFEWYKFVALLCNFYSSIRADSLGVRSLPSQHYAVLIGLLNRCARLMLANVALSHKGGFGETTAIIDRCIFESAVKTTWLCTKRDADSFIRFIADGLKTELEFKDKINSIIRDRGGSPLEIESRMLRSISNYITGSGLTEAQITDAKKLPDLASMIDDIGHDRLLYLIGQKIGSHHIHGTWVSLRFHYLTERDGLLAPRDHNCATHVNQYMFVPLYVMQAMEAFVHFVFKEIDDARAFSQLLDATRDEMKKLFTEVVGNDFEQTEDI